jgi:hypothetical protein
MSADDFLKLQAEINPAGHAFTERLQAAQREFAQLQAVEQQLAADQVRVNAHVRTLRESLEGDVKALTAAHAKRARIAKDLAACDEEIAKLEAQKAETSRKIHSATARATNDREKKLRELDNRATGGSAQPPAPPVADLLGGPTPPPPPPPAAKPSAAQPDLLSLGDELTGPAQPTLGALDDLLTAVAPAPPIGATALRGGASAGGNDDAFDGFDVSDHAAIIAPPPAMHAAPLNPFDQPPAGMLVGSGNHFGAGPLMPLAAGAVSPTAQQSLDPFADLRM